MKNLKMEIKKRLIINTPRQTLPIQLIVDLPVFICLTSLLINFLLLYYR